MNETTIFDFEKQFAAALQRIPMAVRFKLDRCGVKLSVRQWARFAGAERSQLLSMPCRTPEEMSSYKQYLIELIVARTDEPAKEMAVETLPAWANTDRVPHQLNSYARSRDLEPPTAEKWSTLTPLQRYALIKLTREGHKNLNFAPAMREFGLLETIPNKN